MKVEIICQSTTAKFFLSFDIFHGHIFVDVDNDYIYFYIIDSNIILC